MAVTKGRDPISPNTLPHVSKKTVVEYADERRQCIFHSREHTKYHGGAELLITALWELTKTAIIWTLK